MAAPNIVNVTSILGKTAVRINADTAGANLITAVATNRVFKLNSLYVANKNASAVWVSAAVVRSGFDFHFAYQISVPGNSTLNVVSKEAPIYLEEGDALKITAGTGNSLDLVASYEDIS